MSFKTAKFSMQVHRLALGMVICLSTAVATAQQAFVRGKGEGPKKEVAMQKAMERAWTNYIGSLPDEQGAKVDTLRANKAAFLEELENIVTDVSVLDEKCDGTSCSVSIKATIRETTVNSILRQVAKAQSGGSATAASAGGPLAFLVMARMSGGETKFDSKVTKRAESTVGTSGSSASADSSGGKGGKSTDESADSVSVTQTSKTVTGGSVEIKRDKITYVPYPGVGDLEAAIGQFLQNSKIKTVPWASLVGDCNVPVSDSFSDIFAKSSSGSIPEETKRQIYDRLRTCGIGRVIFASISVDGFRTDPNTGAPMATGNLNVQAFDLTSKFVSSLGTANKAISGRAAVELDAARNALSNASKVAADMIIQQLNQN